MAKIFKWNPNQTATGQGVSVSSIVDTETGIVEGVGMGCGRVSSKTAVNRDNVLYSTLSGEPAMTLKDGVLVASLESESENLITYSEDFTQWGTDVNRGDLTANVTTAPNGTITASKLSKNTESEAYRYIGISSAANDFYIFVKDDGSASPKWMSLQASTDRAWFNFQTGDVGSVSGNVTSSTSEYVGSGWWKFSAVGFSANNLPLIRLSSSDGSNSASLFSSGDGMFIWGAGTNKGSYIPTNGSTQTRDADTGFKTPDVSSLINLNSGVLEVEMAALVNGSERRYISIDDGNAANIIRLGYSENDDRMHLLYRVNNVDLIDQDVNMGENQTIKAKYTIIYNESEVVLKRNDVIIFNYVGSHSFSSNLIYLRLQNVNDINQLEANVNYLKFTSNG